jgi:hypothetical protein
MRLPTLSPGSTEARWLGIVRIGFGLVVLLRTTPLLAWLDIPFLRTSSPLAGWPTPSWRIAAFGLALPASLVAALCIGRTIAVVFFTAGVRAREAGVVAALCGWVVLAQDALAYINTMHLLFLGLAVLALGGSGSAWALIPERGVDPPSGIALVRGVTVSVYAWSGLAKLTRTWLSGATLAQLHEAHLVRGALVDTLLSTRSGPMLLAWVVAAGELAMGPLLLVPKTRRAAIVLALTFHATLQVAMSPDFFGFAMAILLLSFFEPGAPLTGTATATLPSSPATR